MVVGNPRAERPGSVKPVRWLAAYIDCETTGLDPVRHELIELAVVLFAYEPTTGEVVGVVEEYTGLREPKVRTTATARQIHGITYDMVRGKQLDTDKVNSMLDQAAIVIAHNAKFDRSFVSRLFPSAKKKLWYCSMAGIHWTSKGFPSRRLQSLLEHHGIAVGEAHRALDDARAAVMLLAQRRSGRTYLAELLGCRRSVPMRERRS